MIPLVISDAFWSNLPVLITSVVGAILSAAAFIKANHASKNASEANKTSTETAHKVDGLLEEKTLADKALGRIEGIDNAAKEKAIGDARELQSMKEQQLLNQTPPNSKQGTTSSDIKDAQDKIVQTIENEVHKQGDKIQDAVKEKGDEIKTEVPDKTADKVVEAIKPPKK